MTGQLDIFADAPIPDDLVVKPESWPPYFGPWISDGWRWHCSMGPHPTWEAYVDATKEWELVVLREVKKVGRLKATLAFDRTTGLWTFGVNVTHKTSGSSSPPGYDDGGFRTRDACIQAALQKAEQVWREYEEQHAKDMEWRKQFRRILPTPDDDDDETGEEGMADRFEDLDEEDDG